MIYDLCLTCGTHSVVEIRRALVRTGHLSSRNLTRTRATDARYTSFDKTPRFGFDARQHGFALWMLLAPHLLCVVFGVFVWTMRTRYGYWKGLLDAVGAAEPLANLAASGLSDSLV